MKPAAAACAAGLALLAWAGAAAAHLPQLRGRLVDLAGRSDVVVIGTVRSSTPIDKRLNTTAVHVDAVIAGELPPGAEISFPSKPRFAPDRRYLFFLGRDGAAYECLQESGTVFPSASAADDASYRQVVGAIRSALRGPQSDRDTALRAALIAALSSPVAPVRYYAILDFAELAHHGLTAAEREALQRLVDDPGTDRAIRPVIAGLLHRST